MTRLRFAAAPVAVALLACACGADEPAPPDTSPDVFVELTHEIYEQTPDAKKGIATGEYGKAAVAYPPIDVDARFSHVLAFQMTPMLPPIREGIPTAGPLILYSDAMEVLVFSPLDHFFESVVELRDGRIEYGVEGEIDEIPDGFRHRFVLVSGSGMARTLDHWGKLLRDEHGRAPVDRYADAGASYLGYWTDNGAAYYYKTADGMTEAETMLAVKADADARGIPLGYLQLDSWWYEKAPGEPPGGLIRWEPQPAMFPDGFEGLQAELKLPLILHNRWFAKENAYSADHDFVSGDEMALPTGRALFDALMGDAKSWGAITYEQDWLMLQWWGVPWLRNGVGHAASWMEAMSSASDDAGLTMQLCMPGGAHVMDSVDRPNVTTVRTSIDYAQNVSKESFWPQFHIVNLVAGAVGLLPFKDNFRSKEKFGEAEALVSTLSAGMVGPSDEIGDMDAKLLSSTCRADGLLLKPDRPAVPIDAMLLDHDRPFTTVTRSVREGVGTWSYVAAYLIAAEHAERTAGDRIWATISYDGQELTEQFPFPPEVRNWHVDLHRDLGVDSAQRVVVYDWRSGEAAVAEGGFDMPPIEHLYGHDYFVIAPILSNGLALIGEPEKFVTLADRRFTDIAVEADAVNVELEGAPAEKVTLRVFDANAGAMLPDVTTTLSDSGTGSATLSR